MIMRDAVMECSGNFDLMGFFSVYLFKVRRHSTTLSLRQRWADNEGCATLCGVWKACNASDTGDSAKPQVQRAFRRGGSMRYTQNKKEEKIRWISPSSSFGQMHKGPSDILAEELSQPQGRAHRTQTLVDDGRFLGKIS